MRPLRHAAVELVHVLKVAAGDEGTEVLRSSADCALIAFTLRTGARDSAITSMKFKHIDLVVTL